MSSPNKLAADAMLRSSDTVRVKYIFNIARGVHPSDEIVKANMSDEWASRYDAFVDEMRTDTLVATKDGPKPRFWPIRFDDLDWFCRGAGSYWDWLWDVCEKWGAALG